MAIFDGSYVDIANAYPNFRPRQFYWIDTFNNKAWKSIMRSYERYGKRILFTRGLLSGSTEISKASCSWESTQGQNALHKRLFSVSA